MAADFSKLEIHETPAGVEFGVKVVPCASRAAIAGLLGPLLRVRVAAPPEGGKANAALIELLADALGISPQRLQICAGHSTPRKRIRVAGLSAASLRASLAE